MNCRRFQHRIEDYLDGTLSSRKQAAAEQHLEGCAACRQAARRRQQLGRRLEQEFRRCTESLTLPPQVRQRVLQRSVEQFLPERQHFWSGFSWPRPAWRLALAGSAIAALILVAAWLRFQPPSPRMVPRPSGPEQAAVSIDLLLVTPEYTFRPEGACVIDALVYHTNVVKAALTAGLDHKPAPIEQERKLPL